MSDTIETKPAILVDYALYRFNPVIQHWVSAHAEVFSPVLLVTYPDIQDYADEDDVATPDIEWGAVIRNTGHKREVEFKLNALSILREVSVTTPSVALDGNFEVRRAYNAEGLLVLDEGFFGTHG